MSKAKLQWNTKTFAPNKASTKYMKYCPKQSLNKIHDILPKAKPQQNTWHIVQSKASMKYEKYCPKQSLNKIHDILSKAKPQWNMKNIVPNKALTNYMKYCPKQNLNKIYDILSKAKPQQNTWHYCPKQSLNDFRKILSQAKPQRNTNKKLSQAKHQPSFPKCMDETDWHRLSNHSSSNIGSFWVSSSFRYVLHIPLILCHLRLCSVLCRRTCTL